MDIWGGLECSVTRLGDTYRDQLMETGHLGRAGDLDRIARLGVRTLRYPVLWEHVSPHSEKERDWSWHDRRLAELRALDVVPIAGLLHHGSGPRYTSLLDPDFPRLFAAYAGDVAQRYPWIAAFTPINEPLTTARFSCLYGHWYPHHKNMQSFLLALFLQCEAINAAMSAIRQVTPNAQLVQTEDVGRTFSVAALRYQAAYENRRRWLSLDLLTGRVGKSHPWYKQFRAAGISVRRLDAMQEKPCPPDVVGINYYLTSDRYLDDRLRRYPKNTWGGNGRDKYADVEAVRVLRRADTTGPDVRLLETWRRYGLPVALTEVHNGSSREEQMRWLRDVVCAVTALPARGVDVRAITIWSMFGSMDWDSLLTLKAGSYESGVFDVRSNPPTPTALAAVTQALTSTTTLDHPVLDGLGWWKRPDRFFKPHVKSGPQIHTAARKVLITGASGTLGYAFARICAQRGISYVATKRCELDIEDASSVAAAIERYRPWAVINTAGYVRVSDAEGDREACFGSNAVGASNLADGCARHNIPFVTFSSDLVFDGQIGRPYVETDQTSPNSVYGHSKALSESYVRQRHPHALVVRSSAFFGPWDRANFITRTLGEISKGCSVVASGRIRVSATYVPDLCHRVLDLLIDAETGVWHLVNQSAVSWLELGHRAARRWGFDPALIEEDVVGEAQNTALASLRGPLLRPLDAALDSLFADKTSTLVNVGFSPDISRFSPRPQGTFVSTSAEP